MNTANSPCRLISVDPKTKQINFTDLFPDTQNVKPGTWHSNGIYLNTNNETIEIVLYREPEQNEEYAGTLTVQIFRNDEVIYATTVPESPN